MFTLAMWFSGAFSGLVVGVIVRATLSGERG